MHQPDGGGVQTLYQSILQGGAVGASACALFAQHLSGHASMIVFSAALGLCTGFVCGLLTWVSTAEFPEAPIPPVRGPTWALITSRHGEPGRAPSVRGRDRRA
jgi:hypothetical protein